MQKFFLPTYLPYFFLDRHRKLTIFFSWSDIKNPGLYACTPDLKTGYPHKIEARNHQEFIDIARTKPGVPGKSMLHLVGVKSKKNG